MDGVDDGLRHAAGIGKAARVAAGIGRQLLLVLGQKRLVHALGRKDAERFLKCEHEVHVAAHALAPRLELFRVARADEHDLAVRVVALDHARGEHHGREGHGNVFLKLREEFFDHVAPRRAAGCDHELVLFGHFLQKVRRLLDHAQVCTDGDLVYVGKAQTLERLAHPLGHALGAELPHERRRERHVHGRVAFDGLNGLEDLALVRDRTERAADHALAAGGALGVVDVGAAEPVGMDAVHAAGLAARALEAHDGVELALLEAASAADALILVDVRLPVDARDGLPRADRHARMLQTALAHVRDLHDVVGAFVAGEFDDVDERLFVVDLRIKRFFHTVRQQRKLRKLAQRQSHSQPQPFADDGTLEKQTVPVCTDLTGDDLERQLFEPLGIIAALVGETCDLREHFVTDTYLSGFNAAHIALLLIEKLVWIREFCNKHLTGACVKHYTDT